MTPSKKNQSTAKGLLKETGIFLMDILYNAVVIIVLVVIIRSFLISPFRVIGSSMADTLENKEFILIDKLSYHLGNIDRGDPIVFLPPATSKDTPKFEEKVAANDEGAAKLVFGDLQTTKKANYCKGVLSGFFFCQEQVSARDLAYYAPLQNGVGSSQQADWSKVVSVQINKADVRQGYLEISGETGKNYMVRVYDAEGPDYFVKRVIGVAGDMVKIENGRVYLKTPEESDFHEVMEDYLNQENANRTYINQKQRQNVYEVPDGHYFVMGDNRNHSNDGRSWLEPITQEAFPFVPEENISGKVLVVLWPVHKLRLIPGADL